MKLVARALQIAVDGLDGESLARRRVQGSLLLTSLNMRIACLCYDAHSRYARQVAARTRRHYTSGHCSLYIQILSALSLLTMRSH